MGESPAHSGISKYGRCSKFDARSFRRLIPFPTQPFCANLTLADWNWRMAGGATRRFRAPTPSIRAQRVCTTSRRYPRAPTSNVQSLMRGHSPHQLQENHTPSSPPDANMAPHPSYTSPHDVGFWICRAIPRRVQCTQRGCRSVLIHGACPSLPASRLIRWGNRTSGYVAQDRAAFNIRGADVALSSVSYTPQAPVAALLRSGNRRAPSRAQSSTRTTRLRRLCLSTLQHTNPELLLHLQASLEAVRCCSAIVLLGGCLGGIMRLLQIIFHLELRGLLSCDLQASKRFPSFTSHANSPRLCTKDICEPACQPVLHRFMWSNTARFGRKGVPQNIILQLPRNVVRRGC